MSTSVKVDDETKSRLERLRAEVRLQTGRRVTQQELLARLVGGAVESKTELVDSFRPERVPLDEDEHDSFHEGMTASGVTTSEEDIDEVLYE